MKILEVGTFALFTLLGSYMAMTHGAWDTPPVRSVVDGGLLFIILFCLLIRRPFSVQFSRERVAKEMHNSPSFNKTNYILTSIWALAMALIVVADLMMHFVSGIPVGIEVAATGIEFGGAYWFTKCYPRQIRKKGERLERYALVPTRGHVRVPGFPSTARTSAYSSADLLCLCFGSETRVLNPACFFHGLVHVPGDINRCISFFTIVTSYV